MGSHHVGGNVACSTGREDVKKRSHHHKNGMGGGARARRNGAMGAERQTTAEDGGVGDCRCAVRSTVGRFSGTASTENSIAGRKAYVERGRERGRQSQERRSGMGGRTARDPMWAPLVGLGWAGLLGWSQESGGGGGGGGGAGRRGGLGGRWRSSSNTGQESRSGSRARRPGACVSASESPVVHASKSASHAESLLTKCTS